MLIPFPIILLNRIIIFVTLTGFVCAYKIHAEEECLFSKVWCYECDSRIDPNCNDPYDDSNLELDNDQQYGESTDPTTISYINIATPNINTTSINSSKINSNTTTTNSSSMSTSTHRTEERNMSSSTTIPTTISRDKQQRGDNSMIEIITSNNVNHHDHHQQQQKQATSKRPQPQRCHGCCVKITSRTIQGVKFIKRTCTSNLQINFFMVDHVCMKESGGRGTMCFCETDYCNRGQPSMLNSSYYLNELIIFLATLLSLVFIVS